jgi:N-acyl-D-amino-acid deacylase
MKGDITVFDPETVLDHATYEAPTRMAEGIVHVFVNGTLAWTQKATTPARSGQFLSRASSP